MNIKVYEHRLTRRMHVLSDKGPPHSTDAYERDSVPLITCACIIVKRAINYTVAPWIRQSMPRCTQSPFDKKKLLASSYGQVQLVPRWNRTRSTVNEKKVPCKPSMHITSHQRDPNAHCVSQNGCREICDPCSVKIAHIAPYTPDARKVMPASQLARQMCLYVSETYMIHLYLLMYTW